MSVIILVIDRLNAGFLGPYGNTWVETPAFNRLAAQSLLMENCLIDSPDLQQVYRSYWSARPAWTTDRTSEPWSLPRAVAAAGMKAALITDADTLVDHPLAADFDEIIHLPEIEPRTTADPQDSAVAQVLQEAVVWLERQEQPFLLWIHSRGMSGGWDAPYAQRVRLADEEDPPPPEWLVPPDVHLAADADPDVALGYAQAYGAQILQLDACLGAFLTAVEEIPAARAALQIVTSPRGFPLGEHGRLGADAPALYAELIQVPCFLRDPTGEGMLSRSQEFTQPFDLCAAIAEWGGWQAPAAPAAQLLAILRRREHLPREIALCVSMHEQAIRTPVWFLRESDDGADRGEKRRELFAKPDDRWEINEVSLRCGDTAERLSAVLQAMQAVPSAGEFPPLESVLRDPWR